MSNLFIFTNDLRLDDNAALYQSSLAKKGLTAAFIFNPKKWEDHNDSPLKIRFQLNHLKEMRDELIKKNINYKIIYADGIEDEPKKILALAKKLKIKSAYINKDYGFNERKKDDSLKLLFDKENIKFNLFDSSILNPEIIKTGSGNHFKVFTPYSKVFRSLLTPKDLDIISEPLPQALNNLENDSVPEYELEDKYFLKSIKDYKVGSNEVKNILESFLHGKIDYKNLRDFPYLDSTSKLSTYLTS